MKRLQAETTVNNARQPAAELDASRPAILPASSQQATAATLASE